MAKSKQPEPSHPNEPKRPPSKYMILRLLGRPPTLVRYVADRPGHDRRYALDSGRLRSTGWRPRREFDEGLAATVAWYDGQRAWWEAVKSGAYRAYYDTMYGSRLAAASASPRAQGG